jgi:hypothetical protein
MGWFDESKESFAACQDGAASVVVVAVDEAASAVPLAEYAETEDFARNPPKIVS